MISSLSFYPLLAFIKAPLHSMVIFEEKNLVLQESFNDLLGFLDNEGIPKEIIVKFSSEFPFCRAFNMVKPSELNEDFKKMKDILYTCQTYSKCYPHLKTSKLIEKIHQNWDNLSLCYQAGKDYIQKKLEKIKKKDPKVMENLQTLRNEYSGESSILN